MEEMKSCPYCGGEILVTAKKCKHCGKWLEQKCPQCGEWVNAEAKKCRYCGYWLNDWARRVHEKEQAAAQAAQKGASVEEIKAAIEEEKENSNAGCLLNIECGLIVGIIGFLYDWVWWKYVVAWVVGLTLLNIQVFRILYCIAISLVWGIIGIVLSPILFDESEWEMVGRLLTEDYSDYWWMGLLFAVVSLSLHGPAMKSRFNF